MQNNDTPADGKDSAQTESESALCGAACSLPSRADLSIRITEALEILDDLERSKVVYGGFAKNCLKRIRETLHPENAEVSGPPPVTHESKQSATGGFAAPIG
jgi:hypothetical protein